MIYLKYEKENTRIIYLKKKERRIKQVGRNEVTPPNNFNNINYT